MSSRARKAYGIIVGWRNYLRDLSVTDNLIRNAHIGIGVSVDPSAGIALITNNLISGAKDGAIRAMNGPTPTGPDLAKASADGLPQPRGAWQRRPLSAGITGTSAHRRAWRRERRSEPRAREVRRWRLSVRR